MTCAHCGQQCERNQKHQLWCKKPECKRIGSLANERAKRVAAGAVVLGSLLICKNCSGQFTKTSMTQYYCLLCCDLAARGKLPSYRLTTLKYQKARNKRRYRTEPAYALSVKISAGIRNSLVPGGKAGRSWEALVGFTIDELKSHIERQFEEGMCWEKMGSEIHIDHIRPLISFSFQTTDDPDFASAWALTNLRPMWAHENIRKSGKRTHLI